MASVRQRVAWAQTRVRLRGAAHTGAVTLGLIVAMGAWLRLLHYLSGRSLWWDEAMIARNILTRDYGGLLQPLDDHQGAPILFLWAEKAITQVAGASEAALRFYPLLAGIAALGLLAWVAQRSLPRPEALVVVALAALADPLIFYSAEVKQYSSDVLVALILVAAALDQAARPLTRRRGLGWALGGALAIWAAHPAIFVLAGVGVALLVESWQRRAPSVQQVSWIVIGALWLVSFGALDYMSLRHLSGEGYLVAYWRDQGAFAPLEGGVAGIGWLGNTYLSVFANPVGLSLTSLAAALFLLGCSPLPLTGLDSTASRPPAPSTRLFLTLCLLPILLTLVASWWGRYPFKDRLILFLIPLILLVMGRGLAQLRQMSGKAGPWVLAVAALLLLAQPTLSAVQAIGQPRTGQEFRAALAYLDQHLQADDVVYIYVRAAPQMDYYLRWQGLDRRDLPVTYVWGTDRRGAWVNHQAELDTLRGRPRVWVVFPINFHVRDGLTYLDKVGKRLVSHTVPGVELLLYDLAPPAGR